MFKLYDAFCNLIIQVMPKNIEVKARVRDINALIKNAKALCPGQEGTLLVQHDTFYNVPNGRLKLREFLNATTAPELIFYDRPDDIGPKISDFIKIDMDNENILLGMKQILNNSVGVRGILKKKRLLFLPKPNIRIHIDTVENLGNFFEIEVCLVDGMTSEDGNLISNNLLEKLGILDSDLISGAYMDIVENLK